MSVKILLATAALATGLAGAASAATLKITESGRTPILGTTDFNPQGQGRLDLGTITATEDAEAYGRVFFTGLDDYAFTVADGLTARIEFIFGGLTARDGSSINPSGQIVFGDDETPLEYAVFDDDEGDFGSETVIGDRTSGDPLIIGGLASGFYNFDIRGLLPNQGETEGASYDVRITASAIAPIPVPASALLLLGAFGGLGFVARRKKA